MSVSANFRLPALVTLPSSALARRLVPSAPIRRNRSAAGLKSMVTIDFNPAADRLRLIGADGTNLRANADDGKVTKAGNLKFAETDMHQGEKPNVVGRAYINSDKSAKETA